MPPPARPKSKKNLTLFFKKPPLLRSRLFWFQISLATRSPRPKARGWLTCQGINSLNELRPVVHHNRSEQKHSRKFDHWHKDFVSENLICFVVDVLDFSDYGHFVVFHGHQYTPPTGKLKQKKRAGAYCAPACLGD